MTGSDRPHSSRPKALRRVLPWLLLLVVIAAGVWLYNVAKIHKPVSNAIASDSRNDGFDVRAHYQYYVNTKGVVLDLTRAEAVAPVDVIRGLFQAAAALDSAGETFEHVTLARNGNEIFMMRGSDFAEIGRSFRNGENPIFLIRTWPEKLYRPDGQRAFGTWEGGLFGVVQKQVEDATAAARSWIAGSPTQ